MKILQETTIFPLRPQIRNLIIFRPPFDQEGRPWRTREKWTKKRPTL